MDAIEERVELGSIDALVRFAGGAWSIVLVAAGSSEPIETVSIDGLSGDDLDAVIDDLLDVVDEVDREAAAPESPPVFPDVTAAGRDAAVALLREVERMVDAGTRVLSSAAYQRFNLLRADIEAPSTTDADALARATALREEVAALPEVPMDLGAVAARVGAALAEAGLVAAAEVADDLDDGAREAAELNSRAMSMIADIERAGDPQALATHKAALADVARRVGDDSEVITHRISGAANTPGPELLSRARSTLAAVDVVVERVVREGAQFTVAPNLLTARAVFPVVVGTVHVASIDQTPVEVTPQLYNRLVIPQGDREDHYGDIPSNAARLVAGAAAAIRTAISRQRSPSEPIVYNQHEYDPRRSYFVEPNPSIPGAPKFIEDKIVLTMVRPDGERYPTGVRLALENETAAAAPPKATPPALDPKAKLRPGPDDDLADAKDLALFAAKLADVRRHLSHLDATIFASERENVASGPWATIEGMVAEGEPVRHRAVELAVHRMGESIDEMVAERGGPAGLTLDEKLALPRRKLFATTAKEDYDGFGTFTVVPASDGYVMSHDRVGEWRGKTRVVSVDERHVEWQSSRYFTGMHRPFDVTEEAVRAFYDKRSALPALDIEGTEAQRKKVAEVVAGLVAEGFMIEGVGYRPDGDLGDVASVVDIGYESPNGKTLWSFVEPDGYAGGGDWTSWPYPFKPSELLRAPPTRENVKERQEAAVLAALAEPGLPFTEAQRASWRDLYTRNSGNKAYVLRLRSLAEELRKNGVLPHSASYLLTDKLKEAAHALPLPADSGPVAYGNAQPLPECPTNGVAFVVPFDGGRGVAVAAYRVDRNSGDKRRVELTDAFDDAVRAAGGAPDRSEARRHRSTAAGIFGAELTDGSHGKAYVYVDSPAIARAAYDSFVASMKPLGLEVRDRFPRGTQIGVSAPLIGESRMAGSDVEIDVSESLRSGGSANPGEEAHIDNVRLLMHEAGLVVSKPSHTYMIVASLSAASEVRNRALYALCPDVYLEEHENDPAVFDLRPVVADRFAALVKPGMKVTWAVMTDANTSGVWTRDVVVTFAVHVLGLADHAVRLGSKDAPRGRTETSVQLSGDRHVIVWPRILTEAERDAVEGSVPAEIAAERERAMMKGLAVPRGADERRMLAAVQAIELKPLVYGRLGALADPQAPAAKVEAPAPSAVGRPVARIYYQGGLRIEASGPGASDGDVNAAAVAGELALAKELNVRHKPAGQNARGVDVDGHVRTTGIITTDPGWMLPDDVMKIKPAQRALMANPTESRRIVIAAAVETLRGRGYETKVDVGGYRDMVAPSTKTTKPAAPRRPRVTVNEADESPRGIAPATVRPAEAAEADLTESAPIAVAPRSESLLAMDKERDDATQAIMSLAESTYRRKIELGFSRQNATTEALRAALDERSRLGADLTVREVSEMVGPLLAGMPSVEVAASALDEAEMLAMFDDV